MTKDPAPGTGQTFDPAGKEVDEFDVTDFQEAKQDDPDLLRRMKELEETNALLKAAVLGSQDKRATTTVSREGDLIGEVEKYVVDPANYDDPRERLRQEPRLKNIAFDHNYELEYELGISRYKTVTGVRMYEPQFRITLNRVVLDENGEQTNKWYIARKLIFHEDPQAAMIMARENGLEVDESNQKQFLNDMRYLRVRDWLFDFFWPKPPTSQGNLHEEVFDNQLVSVFTKSSVEPSEIPFDQIKKKV